VLVEVEVHTVPHSKAPINGEIDLWGPECGGIFVLDYSLVNRGHLLHKSRPVPFVSSSILQILKGDLFDPQKKTQYGFLGEMNNFIFR